MLKPEEIKKEVKINDGKNIEDSTPKPARKSVFAKKKQLSKGKGQKRGPREATDEYEQKIVDIARVTRVMAGGKRMRFRACVAIGDKKGKIGLGVAKGADVTIAVTKAVNDAKKNMIDVSIVNETIPHEVTLKLGAAKVLLKPARKGKGVIAGGAIRIVLELSGIKNITSKNLGTSNKLNVARCTIEAIKRLKRVEVRSEKKTNNRKEGGKNKETEIKQ